MSLTVKKFARMIMVAAIAGALGACATTEVKKDDKAAAAAKDVKEAAKPAANNDDLYIAHEEGRIHVFDDAKAFHSFLKEGETPYRLTRIGAGPNGETVVFGLTDKDKEKQSGIAGVDMYDGKLGGADNFYGEIVKHGRYYVFGNWKDMQQVIKTGEPVFMFTDIGTGPAGATVVYVLNKTNNEQKPVELIAQFKQRHAL